MKSGERSGFFHRGTASLVQASSRQPWLVLSITAVIVLVSVVAAAFHLNYKTQRNDLISKEKDCQRRWQRVLDAFGEDDDCAFVIRGHDKARMTDAAERLAAKLLARPEQFDRVFHKVDLRCLQSRSLQYAELDEIREIDRRLDDLAPMLGSFSTVSWHSLTLETLLGRAAVQNDSPADRKIRELMPNLLRAAKTAVTTPEAAVTPWGERRNIDDRLAKPQYFFSPDGELLVVLARPRAAGESFTPAKDACESARAIVNQMRSEFVDLEFGLTGLPVLETDEMAASEEDSAKASLLALAGVALLYIVVYRGFRYPLLTVSTLLVGTAAALGWATLTIGHLNILSATFAVMIIGMGDYGVIWVAHYDEQRRLGATIEKAMTHTVEQAGPGILTAAITASLAFGATMLADFQAVVELGWIAGWGIIFCALSCFTVLPALLVLTDRRRSPRSHLLPFPAEVRSFLPGFAAKPKSVLFVSGLILTALAGGILAVRYDANLLNMQARGLESVKWEQDLIDHAAGATWDALSLAGTREEALRLKQAYEASPGVGRVVESASLIPVGFDAKKPYLESIHRKLAGLPSGVPDFTISSPTTVTMLCRRVNTAESRALADTLEAMPANLAPLRLRAFDRTLRSSLHADLQQLQSLSVPERIAIEDIPASFRERTIAPNGSFLVRACAKDSLWDYDALLRFTDAARSVDANATGKSFRTLEGLDQMKAGFVKAGVAAVVVIVLVLSLDFRSPKYVLLGLLPLALGLVATFGVMGWLGLPLNPANLIALPLIVGVGVDNGVHVLHDFREKRDRYRLSFVTGRGICVASLTTILGFGTLMLARHRGMAGLGTVLTVGVTACMTASLIVLPAVLRLISIIEPMKILLWQSPRKRARIAA